jgi:hypothetical protein
MQTAILPTQTSIGGLVLLFIRDGAAEWTQPRSEFCSQVPQHAMSAPSSQKPRLPLQAGWFHLPEAWVFVTK